MRIDDISNNVCTGCKACEIGCPYNAIQFGVDIEGFAIPIINEEKCVNCGRCYVICPSNKSIKQKESIENYIVHLKDRRISRKSASGGAFIGIATFFLSKYKGAVVGAAICDDLVVRHIVVTKLNELKKLQNSKYVQSDIGKTFYEIKNLLKQGKKVLFSGTPCQIEGLYSVLTEKERTQVITVDIVCHGVPSPAFLKRQLEEESKTKQGKVKEYKFRFKKPYGESVSSYFMIMLMEHGLPMIKRTVNDPYYNLFMKGLDFRECCYKCKYANLNRVGDFTVGDCDSHEYYMDFFPNSSNSILLLNSNKAKKIWDQGLESLFFLHQLDLDREAIYNHQLREASIRPKERDGIYEELLNSNWENIKIKYTENFKYRDRYKLILLLYLPDGFKKILGKIRWIVSKFSRNNNRKY